MNGTDNFKKAIEAMLSKVAEQDELFAATLQKPNKNINDCITYILNTVQKSGCNGFTDDEILNMAIHYYDEDNVEVGSKIACSVVVNHKVELTDEEVQAAKEAAKAKIIEEELEKRTAKPVKKKEAPQEPQMNSLF
jgi:hypothetical protein